MTFSRQHSAKPIVWQRPLLPISAWYFLAVFLYSLCAMIIGREWIVPAALPSVAGHILGDPKYYHDLAVEQAGLVSRYGWGKFSLHPAGQGPAGIASLIYLCVPSVYGVVLLNALLHALACSVLVILLRNWFPMRVSILGAIPLALSPAMIVWYSQVNKDIFAEAGAVLFLTGFTLYNVRTFHNRPAHSWTLATLIGIALIWLVRPYLNQVMLPAAVSGVVGFLVVAVLRGRRDALPRLVFHSFLVLGALVLAQRGAASDQTFEHLSDDFKLSNSRGLSSQEVSNMCLEGVDVDHWKYSQWLPQGIDRKLKALAVQRCLTFQLLSNQHNPVTLRSVVDTNVLPSGSSEMIAYIPRAAALGVLSPWPSQWPSGTFLSSYFFTIVPLEMLLYYVGLLALVRWSVLNQAWFLIPLVLVAATVMLAYGMSTPFIGALYRYRYPFWSVLFSFGVAAIVDLFCNKSRANACGYLDAKVR